MTHQQRADLEALIAILQLSDSEVMDHAWTAAGFHITNLEELTQPAAAKLITALDQLASGGSK